MKFYDVPVNQSILTEANRGLISYKFHHYIPENQPKFHTLYFHTH
jgi:hypothetical protein